MDSLFFEVLTKLTVICFTYLSILSGGKTPPKETTTKKNFWKQSVTGAKHSMCNKSYFFQFVYFKYARAHVFLFSKYTQHFVIVSVIVAVKNHYLISLSNLSKKTKGNQSKITKKLICLPRYIGKLIKCNKKDGFYSSTFISWL